MLCPSQQEGIGGERYRIAESTEGFIEDQAYLQSSDSAPGPPPLPPASCHSFSVFLCRRSSLLTGRVGGEVGEEPNHTTRESLALHKFNTLLQNRVGYTKLYRYKIGAGGRVVEGTV